MEEQMREIFDRHYSTKSVNDAVYDTLLEALVVQNIIPAGTHLSSIKLAKLFDISRTPVQMALLQLDCAGLIRHDGKNRYMTFDYTFSEGRDMNEYMLCLYDFSSRLAQNKIDIYYKTMLARKLDQLDREKDVFTYLHADTSFHRSIVQITGNKALLDALDRAKIMSAPMRLETKCCADTGFILEHQAYNRELYEKIIGKSESELAQAVAAHNSHMLLYVCKWLSDAVK